MPRTFATRIVAALVIVALLHGTADMNGAHAPGASQHAADSRTPLSIPGSLPPAVPDGRLPTAVADGTLPTAAPARLMTAFVAATPDAVMEIASLPRQSQPTPTPTVPSSPVPTPIRDGCDPAYPDTHTCIPPGPPFAQGCAITTERRFTVLSPDPQRLDHDKDGIGCEPIAN